MQVKNKLINIKNGNKNYEFNNLILNEYLNKFVENHQLGIENPLLLDYILLKFDTPLDFDENFDIYNSEFDICLISNTLYEQTVSKQKVSIKYDYNLKNNTKIIDYSKGTEIIELSSEYYDRKITAIGFNTSEDTAYGDVFKTCAVLDTSNYDIYLRAGQDFNVTRKDEMVTGALFYSDADIKGPMHLAPLKDTLSYLYSVGLSSYIDRIDKEFIIGKDVYLEMRYSNNNYVKIKGVKNYFVSSNPLFCSKHVICSENVTPVKANYKYVILKYRSGIDYYYLAIPITKYGKQDIIIKYERS